MHIHKSDWLTEWEDRCDLCLALGTSLCGMNADRIATTPAVKAMQDHEFQCANDAPPRTGSLGLVIINLQQTQYDECASIRIFGSLDDVMTRLAKKLRLRVSTKAADLLPRR